MHHYFDALPDPLTEEQAFIRERDHRMAEELRTLVANADQPVLGMFQDLAPMMFAALHLPREDSLLLADEDTARVFRTPEGSPNAILLGTYRAWSHGPLAKVIADGPATIALDYLPFCHCQCRDSVPERRSRADYVEHHLLPRLDWMRSLVVRLAADPAAADVRPLFGADRPDQQIALDYLRTGALDLGALIEAVPVVDAATT